jgi:hypothetical protein
MGIVYAAYDAKLDREIALKLLRPELNRFAEERLDREAKLMARLAHPNVITIHDVGTLAGQAYVAMELVVGETLGQKLRSMPRRPWREVLALFLAAGRGLAAAHREGVVHRDFKPDEVATERERTKHRSVLTAKCLQPVEDGRGTMFGCEVPSACCHQNGRDLHHPAFRRPRPFSPPGASEIEPVTLFSDCPRWAC